MYVIFAEKPSQAREYVKALSNNPTKKNGYYHIPYSDILKSEAVVTWGFGHLLKIKSPEAFDPAYKKWDLAELPIAPLLFWKETEIEEGISSCDVAKQIYEINTQGNKKFDAGIIQQVNIVSKILTDANKNPKNTIISAVDLDREASNIFYSLLEYNGIDIHKANIKRLWINSLERDSIREGFANLRDKNQDIKMYEEAKTRAFSDWLMGMNLSRLYTLSLEPFTKNRELFRMGRIKASLLYMINDRDNEVLNFQPESFYEVKAEFTKDDIKYEGRTKIKETDKNKLLQDNRDHYHLNFDDMNEAVVTEVKKEQGKEKPQSLHSLSSLQNTANKYWDIRPHEVTKICQELYEAKLTSYPRTDCHYITTSEYDVIKSKIPEYQKLIGKDFPINQDKPSKKFVDNSKVQEHSALIVTKTPPSIDKLKSLSDKHSLIYKEILLRSLCMFAEDCIVDKVSVTTNINDVEFKSNAKETVSPGWRDIYKMIENTWKNTSKEEKTVNDKSQNLNQLEEQTLVNGYPTIKEGTTSAPSRYSEGQLVTLLETAGKFTEDEEYKSLLKDINGIGKPSTRSSIIKECFDNGYLEIKKKKVMLTDKGKLISSVLEKRNFAKPEHTAKMEKLLSTISEADELDSGIRDQYLNLTVQIVLSEMKLIEADIKQDNIQTHIESMNESAVLGTCPMCKTGEINKGKAPYRCSNESCTQVFFDQCFNKKLSEANIKSLLSKNKTPVIKGFKNKQDKPFDTALMLEYDEERKMYVYTFFEESVGTCPACKQERLVYNQKFYKCTNHDCTTTISGHIGANNKKITPTQIKQMIDGRRVKITNIESKKGNKFDTECSLKYDTEKNRYVYQFHFDNKKKA